MGELTLTGWPQPLSGLRVLDITYVVYGPYTTQILGDFGADVIKIESPEGDMTRAIGVRKHEHMSSLYLGTNRNKRGIVLDLKTEAGKVAMRRLIETSHVLVHNIRPQKMEALGLGPEAVMAINPQMIYAALLGYRGDGAYGGRPAYDDVIQGQSGLAGMFTAREGEPRLQPTIAADKGTALMAVSGIMAAVIRRMASGKGVYIETSMLEGMASYTLLEHQHAAIFNPPLPSDREGGYGYPRTTSPERRPYPTADGHICVLAYTNPQWHRLWEMMGLEELRDDPRFDTIGHRADNIDALYARVGEKLAEDTSANWLSRFTAAEIPCGPVHRLQDLKTDEHLASVNFFRPFTHPTEGEMEIPDTPYRIDGEGLPIRHHQPGLGEHTEDVLREAGVDEDVIAAVIGGAACVQSDS